MMKAAQHWIDTNPPEDAFAVDAFCAGWKARASAGDGVLTELLDKVRGYTHEASWHPAARNAAKVIEADLSAALSRIRKEGE
jgi:hypothetical protein